MDTLEKAKQAKQDNCGWTRKMWRSAHVDNKTKHKTKRYMGYETSPWVPQLLAKIPLSDKTNLDEEL